MKLRIITILSILTLIALPKIASSHCEIPCGIYNDETRFSLLAEHITTIEKSMNKITEISSADQTNQNQLVRWINNKEEHAIKFMDIVTQYFMTQRIKVVAPDADGYDAYVKKVTLSHNMMRTAMKCKQTIDTANTSALSRLLKEFEELYMASHKH